MEDLKLTLEKQKEVFHHAYLIIGDIESNKKTIEFFINDNFKDTETLKFDYDVFGIDNARLINDIQNRKNSEGVKRFFIVSSNSVTRETQNSLLKMFEEPSLGNYFFWLVNNDNKILDTIKSRLISIKTKNDTSFWEKEASTFLDMNIKDREEYIKRFLGDNKKDIKADKVSAYKFIFAIESMLIEKKYPLNLIKKIVQLRLFIEDRSSSVKNILEFLSVSLIKK